MATHLTIGELAKAGDVPTSTVRYYERAGLLRPSRRSGSNYRLYSNEDLHRLRFVRAAQATGFTLDDIKHLPGARGDGALRGGRDLERPGQALVALAFSPLTLHPGATPILVREHSPGETRPVPVRRRQ